MDTKLIALGSEKADTIKCAYAEKEAVNQIAFVKLAAFGEVLVVVNQGGGVFVSAHATRTQWREQGNLSLGRPSARLDR